MTELDRLLGGPGLAFELAESAEESFLASLASIFVIGGSGAAISTFRSEGAEIAVDIVVLHVMSKLSNSLPVSTAMSTRDSSRGFFFASLSWAAFERKPVPFSIANSTQEAPTPVQASKGEKLATCLSLLSSTALQVSVNTNFTSFLDEVLEWLLYKQLLRNSPGDEFPKQHERRLISSLDAKN